MKMNLEELRNKVDLAIDMFFARDSKLLDIHASEWAIAHRIAVYFEKSLKGWNVDCEYNRVALEGNTKRDAEGVYRRPDIIVHHRGMVEKEHNLLVIEVKIRNTPEDYRKLMDFTSPPRQSRPFQYQYGLALSFDPHKEMVSGTDAAKITNGCIGSPTNPAPDEPSHRMARRAYA
jgi:hypothetical protein